jgi:hypothetical protein
MGGALLAKVTIEILPSAPYSNQSHEGFLVAARACILPS